MLESTVGDSARNFTKNTKRGEKMKKLPDKVVFAAGGMILITAVIFGLWTVFIRPYFQEPVITVRPNTNNLTMAEILKQDNVILSPEDWKQHGKKLNTIFPVSVTVQYAHINLELYHRDIPENVSAVWKSKFALPHVFQFSPTSSAEFRKYVRR